MIQQPDLVKQVCKYNPKADASLLNGAYEYAMQKHGTQKRASGDSYIYHPLEVAGILANLNLDDATIAVALLHDTIEDTDATRSEIDNKFGKEIGKLVDGLTKISRLDLTNIRVKQAENFRKLLLAIADDVRVLLVKLADRLHNMRTIEYVPEDKRQRIAEETRDIYAPLAGRMGMQAIRDELEDLSFRSLNLDTYSKIEDRLEVLRKKNKSLIADIEKSLKSLFRKKGIRPVVRGREKQPYSIFRKMQKKEIGFEQLSDIYGFRIICDTVEDCYNVLGVVHTSWRAVPGRFKDYISTPKQNDYQSIHTTVVGPKRQRVELQIRTLEMDRFAECGIAAHAIYKDGQTGGRNIAKLNEESKAYEWLRNTIDLLSVGDSPEEFLEHTKLELFQDQVFCFTPKGRLITLPTGATPIDFAYAVHTDIGNSCVGCKINGKVKPLVTPLQNGDEVEVIKSSEHTTPRSWESIAITGKARAAIRRVTRDAMRKQYVGLGRQIMESAFEKLGEEYSDQLLKKVLRKFGKSSMTNMLIGIGRLEFEADEVVQAIFPDHELKRNTNKKREGRDRWFNLGGRVGLNFSFKRGNDNRISFPIRGIQDDLPVNFAPECGAVPGDRIVGIMTPGEGVTVYPIHSPLLEKFDNDNVKWLDLSWDIDDDNQELFPACISLSTKNEPGALAQIAATIGDNSSNIDNIRMVHRERDFFTMVIDLEVFDLVHLNRIISQLREKSIVAHVERING